MQNEIVVPSIMQPTREWHKPNNPFIKINCDAAFDDVTKYVGIGLISRQCVGIPDGARCCRTKALDSEQAEAKAILEAPIWERRKGYRHVHLEGDCLDVISTFDGKIEAINWTIRNLINGCRSTLNFFNSWKCPHVFGDVNRVAHMIAKEGIYLLAEEERSSQLPTWILQCIHRDVSV